MIYAALHLKRICLSCPVLRFITYDFFCDCLSYVNVNICVNVNIEKYIISRDLTFARLSFAFTDIKFNPVRANVPIYFNAFHN